MLVVVASELDLKFKVKFWPKFGTLVKFNINGRFLVQWWPSTAEVQQCQSSACDLDQENEVNVQGSRNLN